MHEQKNAREWNNSSELFNDVGHHVKERILQGRMQGV